MERSNAHFEHLRRRRQCSALNDIVSKATVLLHWQASGEATFTSDIGLGSGQLFAATVATTQAAARIVSIDASAAEKVHLKFILGIMLFFECFSMGDGG